MAARSRSLPFPARLSSPPAAPSPLSASPPQSEKWRRRRPGSARFGEARRPRFGGPGGDGETTAGGLPSERATAEDVSGSEPGQQRRLPQSPARGARGAIGESQRCPGSHAAAGAPSWAAARQSADQMIFNPLLRSSGPLNADGRCTVRSMEAHFGPSLTWACVTFGPLTLDLGGESVHKYVKSFR